MDFPHFYQSSDNVDCGPTCIQIIAKFYGKSISSSQIRKYCKTTKNGSNLLDLANSSEILGFKTTGVKIGFRTLRKQGAFPCIIHWNKNHYVVLYKLTNSKAYISDPLIGLVSYSKQNFLKRWRNHSGSGVVLFLKPETNFDNTAQVKFGWRYLFHYLAKYQKLILQMGLGILGASIINLAFPLITQSLVDTGIQNQDIPFIILLLISQLFLFIGKIIIEITRALLHLHLGTRINIEILSDFFKNLMNQPISFFDGKITGDLFERINDTKRIEVLMTSTSMTAMFAIVNITTFSAILAYYNFNIFFIFISITTLYLIWIIIFLKSRASIDYTRFYHHGLEHSKVIEIINGMQEIMLNNAEKFKRWEWESIKAKQFKIETKYFKIEQFQSQGANFWNELKNIIIIGYAATLVITGDLTLGMMLAIAYIVGQLNGPVLQLSYMIQQVQDAMLSLNRLSKFQNNRSKTSVYKQDNFTTTDIIDTTIKFNNVSFKYNAKNKYVLRNVNVSIPNGKTTAIVGSSGSGKSTMLRLMLQFHTPETGNIMVGNINLNIIESSFWRRTCGVVLQEGFIFNDTIAKNIALVDGDDINFDSLYNAARIANIHLFVESLPLKFNTKIGHGGIGLSTGQKQRLRIARAIYKNPEILLLDEATSALDTKNERIIISNIKSLFYNKTTVIIAHRLSTIKDADQILVLDNGTVQESGNHEDLILEKGIYFDLMKSQLTTYAN